MKASGDFLEAFNFLLLACFSNMFSISLLIYPSASAKICIWGVPVNGKWFAFRRNKYILRTSSIFGGGTSGK